MDSERVRPALVPTGDSRVDAAIGGLASLEDTDLAERPAVLEVNSMPAWSGLQTVTSGNIAAILAADLVASLDDRARREATA